MSARLAGRVVLVSGAARGIGRGIAEAVAEAGADVVLADLDLAGAEAVAERLRAAGRRALALRLDVSDHAGLAGAARRCSTELGRLDGWVNNAGLLRMAPALEIDRLEAEAQWRVNVEALLAGCRAAALEMRRLGRGGAIVNVASNAGKVGYPNMAVYNATKAAVVSLTRSLAGEWAELGINVNAVCPGGVATPMLRDVAAWLAPRLQADAEALYRQMVPRQLGRHVEPIEVGRVVAFLLSDEALIIRGQALNVDGGDTPY